MTPDQRKMAIHRLLEAERKLFMRCNELANVSADFKISPEEKLANRRWTKVDMKLRSMGVELRYT